MNFIIAGDLVPTNRNIDLFRNADIDTLLGEDLLEKWNSADVRMFNLEAPLADKSTPIDKWGPNLIAPTSTVKGIKALNPSLITLANNHIMDQGEEGFISTVDILNENKIPFVGVGDSLREANKPYILTKDGLKIGIYACAEHEFSIAGKNSSGANPFDPLESLDHINALKQKCDYVIVLYHGGKEHYRYPSPYLQKVCRKMVEKGADLVVCQHSHCIGCYETYNNSTIVYGQGNFIFNQLDNEYWNSGLLIEVDIGFDVEIDYIPFITTKQGVTLVTGPKKAELLNGFHQRSHEIMNKGFVEEKYKEFAAAKTDFYLRKFSGSGKWISRIDRYLFNGKLLNKMYDKSKLLAMQNYIECEAHKELVLAGLKGDIVSE